MAVETVRAKQAWADYLGLGAGRSLEKLVLLYQQRQQDGSKATAPTSRLRTLCGWSTLYGWQARLKAIAEREARETEERLREYRRAIMEEGLALDHERVRALKGIADILLDELHQPDRRWVRDVKQVGSGESAQMVDIERFNAAEVEQLRGLLADIAQEKGERQQTQKHELTGKGGGPIEVKVEDAREQLAARLAALAARRGTPATNSGALPG